VVYSSDRFLSLERQTIGDRDIYMFTSFSCLVLRCYPDTTSAMANQQSISCRWLLIQVAVHGRSQNYALTSKSRTYTSILSQHYLVLQRYYLFVLIVILLCTSTCTMFFAEVLPALFCSAK